MVAPQCMHSKSHVCVQQLLYLRFCTCMCIMSGWRGHPRRMRFTNTNISLAWWRAHKERKRKARRFDKKNSLLKWQDRRHQLPKHAWLWEEANFRTGMFSISTIGTKRVQIDTHRIPSNRFNNQSAYSILIYGLYVITKVRSIYVLISHLFWSHYQTPKGWNRGLSLNQAVTPIKSNWCLFRTRCLSVQQGIVKLN